MTYQKRKRDDLARWMEERRLELERRTNFGDLVDEWKSAFEAWNMDLPRATAKPWLHASEYNPPLIYSKTEDLFSILFGFVSDLTFFRVRPAESGGASSAIVTQRAENWDHLIKNRFSTEVNWSGFVDNFIHDGVLYGYGCGETGYERLDRTVESEIFVPDSVREASLSDKQTIQLALGPKLSSGLAPVKDGFAAHFWDDDRQEKIGVFRVERNHPYRPEGDASILVRRIRTEYDGVRLRNVQPWEIMVPASAVDLQSAKRYFVRRFLTLFEIRRFMVAGLFNQLSREDYGILEDRWKVQTKNGRLADVSDSSTSHSWPHDDWDSGVDSKGTFGDLLQSRRDEFEVWFEYSFSDIDSDGVEESVVQAYISPQTAPLYAMEHRIESLYPHGRRPHFDWRLIPVSGRYYGTGLGERLFDAQLEENFFYQKRSDVLEITTNPGGFYDPNSGLAPAEIRWTPGMLIKANLEREVFRPFVFAADPSPLFAEQSGIDMQAERAVGSTDMGLGRSSGRPNSPRTLGGTAILVRQQQLRTNSYLQRLLTGQGPLPGGLRECLYQSQALMAAFMPPEVEFQLIGTEEMRRVNREDLAGRFHFMMDFSEEHNNPQLAMQNALLAYDRAIGNPLIAQDPTSLWHITTRMLEATGMKDAKAWVRKPDGLGDRPDLPPQEVLRVLAKGIRLRPNPTENHGQMAAAIMALLEQPDRLAAAGFTPQTIPLLDQYAQETMQYMLAGNPGPLGDQRVKQQARSQGAMGNLVSQEQVASPIGGGGDGAL